MTTHLDDRDLLRLAEGSHEMRDPAAFAHLRGCWRCRETVCRTRAVLDALRRTADGPAGAADGALLRRILRRSTGPRGRDERSPPHRADDADPGAQAGDESIDGRGAS